MTHPSRQLKQIRTLLVANRGEIATRIFRTCKRLGIRTVAIFSDADRYALHTRSADKAIYIGPSEANTSYLKIDAVLAAITGSGADAVHPGYGFLSENAAFSDAVEALGVTFLGPTAKQMHTLGDKEQAKERARMLVIPVLESARVSAGILPTMPFPLMIKARAGGGGRGMRIVRNSSEFAATAQSAAREALSFFNDGTLFVERFIERARHVEVQLLGDGTGKVTAVGDRDCSVQRRHQKVLEEAPAWGLSPQLRTKLHTDSERLLASVAYCGAGTAEFLVCGEEYFFLEVNTRLQVEHPVTEAVTGLDLVELQIRIGEGKTLAELLPIPPTSRGHAIELRLCAERPSENFAPATGTLAAVYLPDGARFDSGFEALDTISHYYDSLLAKIICVADSRPLVIAKAIEVLSQPIVLGVDTNQFFLRQLVNHLDFGRGEHFTRWVESLTLCPPPGLADTLAKLREKVALLKERRSKEYAPAEHAGAAQRPGFMPCQTALAPIGIDGLPDMAQALAVSGPLDAAFQASIRRTGRGDFLFVAGHTLPVYLGPPRLRGANNAASAPALSGAVSAPLPGKIIEIRTPEGASVVAGEVIAVLESMKMEHPIKAPVSGVVKRMCVASQQVVEAGTLVAEVAVK